MSQTIDSKKPYDGKSILTDVVFKDRNKLGKYISSLWIKLGGSEKEFEKQQVGPNLEIAAKTTLMALHQCTRRITGIAGGTGNTTPQAHNKGLLWTIEPKHGKIAITDLGTVAMTTWLISAYPSEDVVISDQKVLSFMAKAAEALIETCGYTVGELQDFESNRD